MIQGWWKQNETSVSKWSHSDICFTISEILTCVCKQNMVVNSGPVIRCNWGFLSTSTEDFTDKAGPVPVLEGPVQDVGWLQELRQQNTWMLKPGLENLSMWMSTSSQPLHATSTTTEGGAAPRVSVVSEPVQTEWLTFGLLGCYRGGGETGVTGQIVLLEWLSFVVYLCMRCAIVCCAWIQDSATTCCYCASVLW